MYSRPNVSKGNGDLIGIGQPLGKYLNFCVWRPKHLWLSKYRSMQLNLPFPVTKVGAMSTCLCQCMAQSTFVSLYKPNMLSSSYMKVRKLSPWATKCIVELLPPSWCHTYTVTNTPTSLHNKMPPAQWHNKSRCKCSSLKWSVYINTC